MFDTLSVVRLKHATALSWVRARQLRMGYRRAYIYICVSVGPNRKWNRGAATVVGD